MGHPGQVTSPSHTVHLHPHTLQTPVNPVLNCFVTGETPDSRKTCKPQRGRTPESKTPHCSEAHMQPNSQQITFERSGEARRHARSLRCHGMGSSRVEMLGSCRWRWEVGGGPSQLDVPKEDHQSPLLCQHQSCLAIFSTAVWQLPFQTHAKAGKPSLQSVPVRKEETAIRRKGNRGLKPHPDASRC